MKGPDLKVGLLTYSLGSRKAPSPGIPRYISELAKSLEDMAVSPVLLSPHPLSSHEIYQRFESHYIGGHNLPGVAMRGIFIGRMARRLGLDIVHDPVGINPPLLSLRHRPRFVVTIHDVIPILEPELQPFGTRVLYRTLIPLAGKTADAILTVSRATAKDLERVAGIPARKIFVTPNGVRPAPPQDLDVIERALRSLGIDRPYFLCVGSLNPRKNLKRVARAFDSVKRTHSDVLLVVVGPAWWRSEELFRETRSNADIRFTGFVSDDILHSLYYGALGLVFPSLYEGFGLPALEAMAHGTAVIASTTGALPEVVGDTALMVNPRSVDEIAYAMRQLLEDSALRTELAQRGRERSRAFSWDDTARKTFDVYRRLGQQAVT